MDINELIRKDLIAARKKIEEGRITKAGVYKLIGERYNVHPERVRKHDRMMKEAKTDIFNRANEQTRIVNAEKGTLSSTLELNFEPKSDEDLAKFHKVDTSKYVISRYFSKLLNNGKYISTVEAKLIKEDTPERLQEEFMKFLDTYKPAAKSVIKAKSTKKKNVAIILPKQDAHYNKFDIHGDNDINARFDRIEKSILDVLLTAQATSNIEEVIYIVGSDEFNSEWTGATTKFTNQVNVGSYHDTFEAIFNHEITSINLLLSHSDQVKVIFIPGNHDEFVGFHLVQALSAYYRQVERITFDITPFNTKYYQYNNTAMMFNHGDVMKPAALAARFPIDFKDNWSSCDHRIIVTGDRHSELAVELHGIKFYRVPQMSSATSSWDNKQGYTHDNAEMNAFVISENNGVIAILKDKL